ncbi:MAG TPA: right-handed parallel beta-helix repeat-containing protein [Thermoanaerobaculia bacterium]|nr:right-handed parallel beta-helix repeat-containing protein [Thermoanaerobaculia bacterium]
MNLRSLVFFCALLLVFSVVTSSPAQAQATRTWVSGVGDDANPCSRTAPCKTLAGAISKTAAGGEISILDPAGVGALTITKSISIVAHSDEAGVLASGTNGIIINAAATDNIVLYGLTFEGLGTGLNGVRFLAGGSLHIENCTINNFMTGIDFEPSGASELFVTHTVVRNNNGASGGGVLIKPGAAGSATFNFQDVQMNNNRFGLRAESNSKGTVRDSVASGNTTNGFLAIVTAGAVEFNLERVTSSFNLGAGVRSDGLGATVRLSDSTITNNGTGLQAVNSGALLTFGNNRNTGNGSPGATTGNLTQQ